MTESIRGTVTNGGGGYQTILVDRSTPDYVGANERVVLVPEELWDSMLPPVPLPDLLKPVPPAFPLSDIDLKMWAVEQVAPLCKNEPAAIPQLADMLIAYVQGDLK